MFDVVQSSWTSNTYLPTWQMDMDWMQPGNNSYIHPTRRRFYIPLRKSDTKKETNKKNKVRKRKAPIHNGFIHMGWHIIHGSVVENILIQNSIVLIQEKEAPPGLSRDRDDVREKRVRGEHCNCSDNKRRTRRRRQRRRTRNWRRERRKESLIERYLNRI
jgi:hypothetical protein